jgi:hypothetical protein
MKRRYAVFAVFFAILVLIGIQAVDVVYANPYSYPSLWIESPENTAYNTTTISVIFHTDIPIRYPEIVKMSCSLDGTANRTLSISKSQTFKFGSFSASSRYSYVGTGLLTDLSNGTHSLDVYALDSKGTTMTYPTGRTFQVNITPKSEQPPAISNITIIPLMALIAVTIGTVSIVALLKRKIKRSASKQSSLINYYSQRNVKLHKATATNRQMVNMRKAIVSLMLLLPLILLVGAAQPVSSAVQSNNSITTANPTGTISPEGNQITLPYGQWVQFNQYKLRYIKEHPLTLPPQRTDSPSNKIAMLQVSKSSDSDGPGGTQGYSFAQGSTVYVSYWNLTIHITKANSDYVIATINRGDYRSSPVFYEVILTRAFYLIVLAVLLAVIFVLILRKRYKNR